MARCNIDWQGGEDIGDGLANARGLEELYIQHNKLKDKGAISIGSSIKYS